MKVASLTVEFFVEIPDDMDDQDLLHLNSFTQSYAFGRYLVIPDKYQITGYHTVKAETVAQCATCHDEGEVEDDIVEDDTIIMKPCPDCSK